MVKNFDYSEGPTLYVKIIGHGLLCRKLLKTVQFVENENLDFRVVASRKRKKISKIWVKQPPTEFFEGCIQKLHVKRDSKVERASTQRITLRFS